MALSLVIAQKLRTGQLSSSLHCGFQLWWRSFHCMWTQRCKCPSLSSPTLWSLYQNAAHSDMTVFHPGSVLLPRVSFGITTLSCRAPLQPCEVAILIPLALLSDSLKLKSSFYPFSSHGSLKLRYWSVPSLSCILLPIAHFETVWLFFSQFCLGAVKMSKIQRLPFEGQWVIGLCGLWFLLFVASLRQGTMHSMRQTLHTDSRSSNEDIKNQACHF